MGRLVAAPEHRDERLGGRGAEAGLVPGDGGGPGWLLAVAIASGVFFMARCLGRAVPDELLEAARPATAVLGLFTFVQAWNDFFWPLVVLRNNPTVQVALSVLASGYTTDHTLTRQVRCSPRCRSWSCSWFWAGRSSAASCKEQ